MQDSGLLDQFDRFDGGERNGDLGLFGAGRTHVDLVGGQIHATLVGTPTTSSCAVVRIRTAWSWLPA